MSEVNEVKPDVKEAAVAPDVKQETGSGTDKAEDYNVPGYRFREVNDKAKALEAELASMKADMKKREEAEAEEREEYKEFMQEKWLEQDGICPISGVEMTTETNHRHTASWDKKDPNGTYTDRSNPQWVCTYANTIKSDATMDEVALWTKRISDHQSRCK